MTVNIKPPDWKLYQIIVLSRNEDTADIRPGDLISFHRADLISFHRGDLIMEATDAAYLTGFTGRPADAVVAAMRIDREIQEVLDSSQVFRYPLAEDDVD